MKELGVRQGGPSSEMRFWYVPFSSLFLSKNCGRIENGIGGELIQEEFESRNHFNFNTIF